MSMWKRQEVQKMSRRRSGVAVVALLMSATGLQGAFLPETFGSYKRVATSGVEITDRPVMDEYGFQAAEHANYEDGGKKFAITAWRLKDSTGAFAATQLLQPGVVQHGNYVLRVDGALAAADLAQLKDKLPKPDRSAYPNLSSYFPEKDKMKWSERYVLGPVSLGLLEPRIPGDLAGFNKGAEGQIARYKTAEGGEAKLVLFSYPTPQIAGERFREFEKRQEWKARRHGPMVALALDAAPDAAEALLSSVTYKPKVSWSEHVPKDENPGDMIEAIAYLALALIAASVVMGMFMGGFRQLFGSRFGVQAIDRNFTSLHLTDEQR
jgi:hypothetical protein